MTTPNKEIDNPSRWSSKQVLVTQDPVFSHPAIVQGSFIGIKPPTYIVLSIIVTIINPLFGPMALIFSYMSNRAFYNKDLRYSEKWSQYAFFSCVCTFIGSVIIYVAIGFTLSPMGEKGRYYWGP